MTTTEHPPQISPTAFRSPGIAAIPPIRFRPSTNDDKPDRPERKRNGGSIRDVSREFLRREVHGHLVAELLAFGILAGCSAVSIPSVLDAVQQLTR